MKKASPLHFSAHACAMGEGEMWPMAQYLFRAYMNTVWVATPAVALRCIHSNVFNPIKAYDGYVSGDVTASGQSAAAVRAPALAALQLQLGGTFSDIVAVRVRKTNMCRMQDVQLAGILNCYALGLLSTSVVVQQD